MNHLIETTDAFEAWLKGLKDVAGRARIVARIDAVRLGRFGDYHGLGGGLFELRFFFGPGYRVYYTIREGVVIFLLHGGDKSRQNKDIEKAREQLAALEE